ncbi:MAG: protein kinase [Polyangiaceae bacterium]
MIALAPAVPVLDKYEVLDEIGHGGMATVYRARDRRLGREVAVKVIHKHLRENQEVAARFVSEARAVAKLKHQNIVEVYDVSDADDPERYLVVELVEGTTLRKLLTDRKCIPAEIAAAIALEIGAALDHAHSHGVIHRDVKPENVLVSMRPPTSSREADAESAERTARIKIADFGIAKLLDAQGVTSTGQVLGSPAHMAPEQIEGGDVTARSDVFGLGVLMYECMVGRLPFDGKNPAQVLRKVLDGTFTPPDRARPSVGLYLGRIVEKALAREQEARFESVAALCQALRSELERVGFSEPRRQLAEYLGDPLAWEAGYEAKLVPKLVELGKAARGERDVTAAAAWFNRALAFRPSDRELLEQIAGLEKRERMRKIALRAGAIVAASAGLGLAAFAVARATRTPKAVASESASPPESAPRPEISAEAPRPPVSGAPESSVPLVDSASPDVPPSARVAQLPRVIPSGGVPGAEGKTRKVQVFIQGAKGTLKIDGAPQKWLGVVHELPVGPHTFEFVPPDERCCVAPAPKTVKIEPGDTVLSVNGYIPYKDAKIRFSALEGATATCPTLFQGTLNAGGERIVKFPGSESTLRGACTLTGPGDEPPRSQQVTLKPGESFPLAWP